METQRLHVNFQLEKALQKIEFCLNDELCIEQLSSISGYSPFHFQRLFKRYTGESVAHYINRLRVEKGALMLKYQNENISDTAIRAGFRCNSSFTRAFEKYYEISPKEFKASYRHNFQNSDIPNFEILEVPDFQVIFIRKCGRYDISEPMSWKTLCECYKHLFVDDTQYISICYDEPSIVSQQNRLRYDACILYEEEKHSSIKDLPTKKVEGGKYAKFEFEGTLREFDEFFNVVFDTFYHDKEYQISIKPAVQIHHNSFKDLLFGVTRTDLLIPLDK